MITNKIITRSDFLGVVNISEHCKEGDEILNQFIAECQDNDLVSLLGNCFYVELLDNLTNTNYTNLLDGGTYIVDGKTKFHRGIKRILIHYAFAAYSYRGGMVDTPFSFVQKMSEDSVPIPTSELKNLRDEHRNIAYNYWKMTEDYLCNNKDTFTCFDDCNCPKVVPCGCENDQCTGCNVGRSNNRRSMKIKVIKL